MLGCFYDRVTVVEKLSMNGKVIDIFMNRCLQFEFKVSKEHQKSNGTNNGDGIHGESKGLAEIILGLFKWRDDITWVKSREEF